MLSVFMLCANILSFVMPVLLSNVSFWLDVIILSAVIPSDFMMGVVMLRVIILNVVKQLRANLPSLAEHWKSPDLSLAQ